MDITLGTGVGSGDTLGTSDKILLVAGDGDSSSVGGENLASFSSVDVLLLLRGAIGDAGDGF